MITVTGKISTFGGPLDTGVAPAEGLALIDPVDLRDWWFRRLFLQTQPMHTTGLARRLDPAAYYIAMRWSENGITREAARRGIFKITNPVNAKFLYAQAADYGPAHWTGRVLDTSPGVANMLGLQTDDEAVVRNLISVSHRYALQVEPL